MRTTLSLDDDVSAQLEQLRARGGRSFKQIVNEALRAGLADLERTMPPRRPGPYTRAVSLGTPRLASIDDVSEALALAEGEQHR